MAFVLFSMWLRDLYDKGTWPKRSFENHKFQDSSGVWASFARDDRITSPPNASECYGNALNTASGGFSTRRKLQASSRDSSPVHECLQSSAAHRRGSSVSPRSHYTLEDTWQLGRRAHCHGQDSSTARDCLLLEPPLEDSGAWVADRSSRAAEEIEVSLGARRPRGSRSRGQSSEGVSSVVFGSAMSDCDESASHREGKGRHSSAGMKDALRYTDRSDDVSSCYRSESKRGRRFLPCGLSPAVPHALRLEFSGVDQRLSNVHCPDTIASVPSAGRPTYFGPMGQSRIGWDIEPLTRTNWFGDRTSNTCDRQWQGYAGLPSLPGDHERSILFDADVYRRSRRLGRRLFHHNTDNSLDSYRSTESRKGVIRDSASCSPLRSHDVELSSRSSSRRRFREPNFCGPRLGPRSDRAPDSARSSEDERLQAGTKYYSRFKSAVVPATSMQPVDPPKSASEDEFLQSGTKYYRRRTPRQQMISSFEVPPWVEQRIHGDVTDVEKAKVNSKFFSHQRRLIQYEPSVSWIGQAQLAGSSDADWAHGGGTKYRCKGKPQEAAREEVCATDASRKGCEVGENFRPNEFGPASNIEPTACLPNWLHLQKDRNAGSRSISSSSPDRTRRMLKSDASTSRRTNRYT